MSSNSASIWCTEDGRIQKACVSESQVNKPYLLSISCLMINWKNSREMPPSSMPCSSTNVTCMPKSVLMHLCSVWCHASLRGRPHEVILDCWCYTSTQVSRHARPNLAQTQPEKYKQHGHSFQLGHFVTVTANEARQIRSHEGTPAVEWIQSKRTRKGRRSAFFWPASGGR